MLYKYYMKKLVCFGDSFIGSQWMMSKELDSIPIAIATHLQNKLNIPIINYGILGSSIQYSLIKFLEYAKSPDYDPDDIIIFIITRKNRFYNQKLNLHVSAIGQMNTIINNYKRDIGENLIRNNTELKSVYKKIVYLEETQKYIEWAMMNFHDYNIDTVLLSCLGLINTWTLSNPNKTVVLNSFDLDLITWSHVPSFKQTANFLPIILQNGLYQYSEAEFIDKVSSSLDWHKECRVNHFSPENREIIADLLFKVLEYNDISMFDTRLIRSNLHNDFDDVIKKYNITPNQFI